jgi:hypothetical protein
MSNPKSKRTQKSPPKRANPPQPKSKRNIQKSSKSQGRRTAVAAAYATGQSNPGPKIISRSDSCRVVHRELVDNVNGAIGFTLDAYSINPGQVQTFRWLSVMAQAWERYRFHMLRFRYITRTGTNTAGSVAMVYDYDSSDAAPATEQIMSSYQGIEEDVPWKDIVCTAKPNRLSATVKHHLVRIGSLGPNQDITLYDCANFYLAAIGGLNTDGWGKLWVEYDVEFFNQQLPPNGLIVPGGSVVNSLTGLTPSFPFGNAPRADPENQQIGVSSNGVNNFLRFFQAGTYNCTLSFVGTTITGITLDTLSNLTVIASSFIVGAGGTTVLGSLVVYVPQIYGTVNTDSASLRVTVTGAATVTAAAFRCGICPNGSQDTLP